jgi:VWFA-related protein
MSRFFRLLAVALLLPLSAASGQTAPSALPMPSPSSSPAETASLPAPGGSGRQITLDVQVTDKAGTPIRGLQKQDFTLLDNKQPQTIASFHAVDSGTAAPNDPPAEVVLVVDAVNANFRTVTYERSEVRKFLLQNGGKLAQPVSLIIFSDSGTKIQHEASRDGNALAALYDQEQTGLRSINRSQGFYGAADRFDLSLKTLSSIASYERGRPGRKLVIWISPGWPYLSGPNVQLTSKDEQHLFATIVGASAGLRQARITLYSVDPLGLADAGGTWVTYYEDFVKGATSPSRALPGDLALQVLAIQSGGRTFNSSNDLTGAIASCASDAAAFYVLSFNSSPADKPDEYHTISVTIDKPGVTARTRTGYYSQP